jgi:hypothetical protein
MAQIAFLLLCHRDPDAAADLARGLVAGGDKVAIHHDGRAPAAEAARLRAALAGTQGIAFTRRRIRCGWGEWSLVQATIEAARTALTAFPEATHFYMISGDCAPIKSAAYAHARLDADDADHIESHDFFDSDWIRTGLREERLIYRHWFNERRQKPWFYRALEWQQRLGLARPLPEGLRMRIGSQWWCLRRATLERVLAFLARRRDLVRFFRTTWIPDETLFQTLVRHLVPEDEIRNRPPTFLLFTDYGVPATFYNDQHEFLLAQDALFARKISREATELRARLTALYASGRTEFAITDDGRAVHARLTGLGRVGRRFAPRFWEAEAQLPRERELLLLACKKWHVAQRLAARIATAGLLPAQGYVFDDAGCPLPDTGGIGATLDKRHRHRRAFVQVLFECLGTDRLLICLDPARLDIVQDLAAAPATVRVLELRCDWIDAEIAGHARRSGAADEGTPPGAMGGIVSELRQDLRRESDALARAGLPHFDRVAQGDDPLRNGLSLARFLSIPEAQAGELIDGDTLFDDTSEE